MALDVAILEEHTKAGVIIAETEHKDVGFLANVPGISAYRVEEPSPEILEPIARVLDLKPGRDVKPVTHDKRGRQAVR